MYVNHASSVLRTIQAVAVLGMLGASARGELVQISARCESRATEMISGQVGMSDWEIERYPETTSVLPMRAESGITSESAKSEEVVGTRVDGIALCFTQFKDPRGRTSAVPDELNIDAATYSLGAELGYTVDGLIVERRTILTTAAATGRSEGEEVELTSTFYIQGLLAAVAEAQGAALDGLLARVEATVVHERPGESPVTVLAATYELRGKADGAIALETAGDADPAHVEDWSLGESVGELQTVRVAVLPAVQLGYNYHATVGGESQLTASLRVKLVSVPGGTGVGAAFGMPGEKIGQTIDAIVGGTAGTNVVRAINSSIAELPAPAIDFLLEPSVTPGGILGFIFSGCGLFGVEGLIGLGTMIGWAGFRTRRRQHPCQRW